MSEPEHKKIFASDALDDLLNSERKHNSNIWLLSYLDVFVLVVMLMVSLLSMSEFDSQSKAQEAKVKVKPHKSSKIIPTVTPPIPSVTQKEPPVAAILPTPSPTTILPTASPVGVEEQMQLELNDKIKRLGLQESIQMTVSKGFAQLDIQDKVLFQSSAAELTDTGKGLLLRLTPLLKESIGLITIEGHTDNRPIKTSQFQSNWELSAARANSVLHYLTSQQLDPERLRAISYADTKPVADNTTQLGREKNRRVNIVIQVESQPKPAGIEQTPEL
ncbi:MAG: OmpA family protein [Methylococcales bacterium]